MKYKKPTPISKKTALEMIGSGVDENVCEALISISLFEPDWRWAQDICLGATGSRSYDVKKCAIIALGHIVRINGDIEIDKIERHLKTIRRDEIISGAIDNLFSDINVYYKRDTEQ